MIRAHSGLSVRTIVSAALAVAVTSILGPSSPAVAQDKKVVVEQFSGPSSDRFRQIVLGALGKISGLDVVPDKKVAQVEADLGLIQIADAYPAVAKELKAGAFVGGSMSGGKKPRAKLTVRGADGGVTGEESWSGADAQKVLSDIEAGIGDKLPPLLGKGGGAKRVAAAESKKDAKGDDKGDAPAKEDGGEADADIAASASSAGSSGNLLPAGLDVSIGAHVMNRKFTYQENVRTAMAGMAQNYKLAAVPAVAFAADYFFIKYVGVTVDVDWVPTGILVSEDKFYKYRTDVYGFHGGVKGRYSLGTLDIEGNVAYGRMLYQVVPVSDAKAGRDVASAVLGVKYDHVRVGAGIRYEVNDMVGVLAGGDFLYILKAGEIAEPGNFKYATHRGGQAYAGVAIGLPFLLNGLEARVVGDFRQIVFNMHSAKTDVMEGNKIAGGATDRYLGVNISIAMRNKHR